MNRDYALRKAYDARITSLAQWQGTLFGAGVLEHVLPLLDRQDVGAVLRSAVDELWAWGRGCEPDRSRAARLQRDVSTHVPHIDDDPSLEGELLRNGGVMVLEALDYVISSDAGRLCASSGGVFTLLTVAVDFFLKRDPGDWEELGEFAGADPVLAEEWNLHHLMLTDVSAWTDLRQLLVWRSQRTARSRELQRYFQMSG